MLARLLTLYGVYLLAAMSPGPAVAFVMRTAVGSRAMGRRAALGVSTGTALWVCVAALGLSAAVQGSPRLVSALRLAGGLYFLWLGWKLGREAARARGPEVSPGFQPRSARAAYLQGLAANGGNPGTALFFTGLFGLYEVHLMPAAAQAAAYLGIPLLSLAWYGSLALVFSAPRLARAYLSLRRPLDAALALLFLFLGARLIASL